MTNDRVEWTQKHVFQNRLNVRKHGAVDPNFS